MLMGDCCSCDCAPIGRTVVLADSMDPGWRGREVYALMKYGRRDDWDDRPQRRKPEDKFVMIGAVVGMVTGGVVGFMINPSLGILGIVGGGVIGALIGSFIGFLMRRKIKAKIPKYVKGESKPSENSL